MGENIYKKIVDTWGVESQLNMVTLIDQYKKAKLERISKKLDSYKNNKNENETENLQ
jgi:hypothetical protein